MKWIVLTPPKQNSIKTNLSVLELTWLFKEKNNTDTTLPFIWLNLGQLKFFLNWIKIFLHSRFCLEDVFLKEAHRNKQTNLHSYNFVYQKKTVSTDAGDKCPLGKRNGCCPDTKRHASWSSSEVVVELFLNRNTCVMITSYMRSQPLPKARCHLPVFWLKHSGKCRTAPLVRGNILLSYIEWIQ